MAATGIVLTNGGATIKVATEAQAVLLEERGWVRGADTASDTTAIGEFPYYLAHMSNPINPSARGTGQAGGAAATIGYMMSQASISQTPAEFQVMVRACQSHRDATITTFTSIAVVNALPTSTAISHTTLYVLSADELTGTIEGGSVKPVAGSVVTNVNGGNGATYWNYCTWA